VTRTARQGLGDAGEQLARRRLEQLGYEFISANWRCREGELDLVMRDGDVVVFVEVKTRRGESLGSAEEAVTASKVARLFRAAEAFLATRPDFADAFWRVDLVAINLARSGAVSRITHLVDAIRHG
jgi:putative endonuclease